MNEFINNGRCEGMRFFLLNQEYDFLENRVSIIYGENNAGKTRTLKTMFNQKIKENLENIAVQKTISIFNLISTNRIIVNKLDYLDNLEEDTEEIINLLVDKQVHYEEYISRVRNQVFKNDTNISIINSILSKLFNVSIEEVGKLEFVPDGINNVLNISCEILWLEGIKNIDDNKIDKLVFLIDEIEMFLHIDVQTRFINLLQKEFDCSFIITTHSPIVLSRTENAKVYKVSNSTITEIYRDLYYLDNDILMETFFGLNEYPHEVNQILEKLDRIRKNRRKKIKYRELEKVEKLVEKKYPNLHSKLISVFAYIKNESNNV